MTMKKIYSPKSILIFILANFCAASISAANIPISIYSPDFSSSYIDNWTLNGNSTVIDNRMRLTDDVTNQIGTIFWTSKICNGDGMKFSSFFTYEIDKTNSQADGIVFIIQQYSNNFGEEGEGMGYLSLPGKSIAVEFDTYRNLSQGDPDNGHIAININGSVDHDDNASYMGLPKSSILIDEDDLYALGIDIVDDEQTKYVWVDYDGTNLQVRISNTVTRPATAVIDIAYDLVSYFEGKSTFFGFGSATGASHEKHYIESVYIQNRYAPIDLENFSYEQGDFSTASDTTVSICEGASYSFNGEEFSADTVVTFNFVNAVGCDSTASLILDVAPTETRWTGFGADANWANPNNWNPKPPTACTNVTIPDVGNGVEYPVISAGAACKNITFEPGGGVLGLQYLTYEKAYVQLSLQRNKWYTLTSPLKSQFSGDYYFEGAPRSYMMLFDEVNPDKLGDGVVVGNWTSPFVNMMVPLTPGMGFGFWVDSVEFDFPNPIIVNTNDKMVYFPRESAPDVLLNTVTPYSGITGKLYPTIAKTLPRDASVAYRFAMENAEGVLEDVRVNIKPGLNLIGNPLMTHLDFDALYLSNEDKISNKVKFWNGTTFVTYMSGSEISSDMNLDYTKIPPMQAFFVEGKPFIGEDTQLDINLAEHFVADTVTKLRAAKVLPKQLLQVKASINDLGSSTVVARRSAATNGYDDQDAFKLFTQYKEVPEVYTIADFRSLDINQFSNLPYMVPLGVQSSSVGFVLLEFINAQSFEGIDVTLLNTMTGEQQNLKMNNAYTLYNDGVLSDGSLFIEFREANTTTEIDENNMCSGRCVSVYAENGTVYATSPPDDKILRFTLWEERGTQICSVKDLNTNEYQVKVNDESQICVARVQTESRTYVVKVMVK